jgi:hypothetical protein
MHEVKRNKKIDQLSVGLNKKHKTSAFTPNQAISNNDLFSSNIKSYSKADQNPFTPTGFKKLITEAKSPK